MVLTSWIFLIAVIIFITSILLFITTSSEIFYANLNKQIVNIKYKKLYFISISLFILSFIFGYNV